MRRINLIVIVLVLGFCSVFNLSQAFVHAARADDAEVQEAFKRVKSLNWLPTDLALIEHHARIGNRLAVEVLAWMFATGTGVLPNYQIAFEWYLRAAEIGVPRAIENARVVAQHSPSLRQQFEWSLEGLEDGMTLDTTGTGFLINRKQNILTNNHVINHCKLVRVREYKGFGRSAVVVAVEPKDDLAILEVKTVLHAQPTTFKLHHIPRLGETVVSFGFPLRRLLGAGPKLTNGTISGLSGPAEDRRLLQISAPIQPGNSGGPLFDSTGAVVGVIVSKLDAVKVAQLTGDIPQNVNFAIRASVVTAFLERVGAPFEAHRSDAELDLRDIADRGLTSTVSVECWNRLADKGKRSQRRGKATP